MADSLAHGDMIAARRHTTYCPHPWAGQHREYGTDPITATHSRNQVDMRFFWHAVFGIRGRCDDYPCSSDNG